jgi:predicted nuclease of predicted toxin-antitoxin system
MPDTLLLDEMFAPTVADDLATRGINCRAVVADPVLRALSDLEIFQAALTEGRGPRHQQCPGLREPPTGA